MSTGTRLPRPLHPGAWWLWALGLAAAASRTTNPLLLGLLLAVAAYVVVARRTDAPWARSFGFFLRLGLVVLLLRVLFQVLFGAGYPGHVLLRLPAVPLPEWLAGVRIGGAVTLEGLATAVYDGLRLAVLLACVGAANALASPGRLLRGLPGALYEAGVAVTVALSFAPQTVVAIRRVREARRLRGRTDRGLGAVRALALPVLEGALDRSVELAAAMDSRGFGRHAALPPTRRRVGAAATVAGLVAVLVGLYGLLDTGAPSAFGVPMLIAGASVAVGGLVVGGRGTGRTRYRPDPWRAVPEWLVAGSGVAATLGVGLAGATALHPPTTPLTVPTLPPAAAVAVLAALAPAWIAPRGRGWSR